MARILIVDDEENIRTSLKSALDRRGHDVATAANCAQAREFVSAGFDVILLDVMLPDGNGIALLKEIVTASPEQVVIMISGHADIDTAVGAIQMGAHDFIEKPLSLDRITVTIDNATRTGRLSADRKRLSKIVYGEMMGESPPMSELRENIRRSAPRADRFLILGENGTGKELAAHMIHSLSRNHEGPFVAVNCAALPSELVESELFGHTSGAFTGATRKRAGRFLEADGGTVFLDEIGEMPPAAQAKILRVLENRTITPVGSDKELKTDPIVIAASNRSLTDEIAAGRFRQDLYYRLNVVTLKVPALSERADDIPLLASSFLERFGRESGAIARRLSDDAVKLLKNHTYPGNVRELKNLMERVSIYVDDEVVSAMHIQSILPKSPTPTNSTLREAVNGFESEYIQSTLDKCSGNMTEASRCLGIERSHLYKKMKKLGIQ